jgi:UDP-N-acetylmuramoyl-L-alanyl-D-glutamate--2,6-diaminopimelate ligase
MLSLLRKLTPQRIFKIYHYIIAVSGALYFRYPTKHLITIGVTGTSGKSTTVFFLGRILNASGHKVGSSSTIEFCIGDECSLNKTKMTQRGRWGTQRFLARARAEKCDMVIVETTSQGIEQFRHRGIFYDVCLLTNLYPEHIESHGSFENYKNAKKKLFAYLAQLPKKAEASFPKTAIVNGSIKEASEFLAYGAPRQWAIKAEAKPADASFVPQSIEITGSGVSFELHGVKFSVPLLGEHVVDNAVAAAVTALAVGVSLEQSAKVLSGITAVPGRAEFIQEGQPFKVLVDFAFEPVAMTKLYDVVEKIPHARIIHVLGGTGGGRDKARRPILGKIAAQHADIVVVTNEDPYDENPREIMDMVAQGAREAGKTESNGLHIIEDRRAAIEFALQNAQKDDIIMVTGKGCEQAMAGPNFTLTAWDDRQVVRDGLTKLSKTWDSPTALK